MGNRRKIRVDNPAEYFSWLCGALEAWSHENGRRKPGGLEVDLDHVLRGLAVQSIRILDQMQKKVSPEEFARRATYFHAFIAEQLGGTATLVVDDGEPDRRTVN